MPQKGSMNALKPNATKSNRARHFNLKVDIQLNQSGQDKIIVRLDLSSCPALIIRSRLIVPNGNGSLVDVKINVQLHHSSENVISKSLALHGLFVDINGGPPHNVSPG